MRSVHNQLEVYREKGRRHKIWKNIVTTLSSIVVFCTVYALILPAITLEGDTFCGQEEHEHGEGCYSTPVTTVEERLVCTLTEEESHIHGEECFEEIEIVSEPEFICVLEEHTHTKACYSDTEADVETEEQWKETFKSVTLTGDWIEDTIAIAKTQLGYTESEKNYQVMENGDVKGYTRYGEWYRDKYGDWCAMFVSFCLNYAEVEGFPVEADCQNWIEKIKEIESWQAADNDYIPERGHIIFFNWDEDAEADHVGIVTDVAANGSGGAMITTIEGDASDTVKYKEYDITSDIIIGYGILPEQEQENSEDEVAEEEPVEQEISENVTTIIEAIAELPTSDEAKELTDTKDVTVQALGVYVIYEELSDEEKAQVENRDKLLELAWLWENKTPHNEQGIEVYQVNSYDGEAAPAETVLLYGKSADEYGLDKIEFEYWTAIVVEAKEDGTLSVENLNMEDGVDKSGLSPETENGFVLLIWHGKESVEKFDIDVGDIVTVPFDYVLTSTYVGESFGTVSFAKLPENVIPEEIPEETPEDIAEEIEEELEVQISGSVIVNNPDGLEHIYHIQLQEVTDKDGLTAVTNGVVKTFEALSGEGIAEIPFGFTISYDKSAIDEYPKEFYYKVTETTNVNDWSTDYDESVYVVKVTALQSEDGLTNMQVTGIWKDGQELAATEGIVFKNEQLYELTLTKRIEGGTSAQDKMFVFEILLANEEGAVDGTYKAANGENTEEITFEAGKATVELAVDESFTIYGLPYAVTFGMKEINAEGYVVSYKIDDEEAVTASETTTESLEQNTEVVYTNGLPYKLPKTGGSGTNSFIIAGMGMMSFSVCLLYNKRKRKER